MTMDVDELERIRKEPVYSVEVVRLREIMKDNIYKEEEGGFKDIMNMCSNNWDDRTEMKQK